MCLTRWYGSGIAPDAPRQVAHTLGLSISLRRSALLWRRWPSALGRRSNGGIPRPGVGDSLAGRKLQGSDDGLAVASLVTVHSEAFTLRLVGDAGAGGPSLVTAPVTPPS